MIVKVQLSVTSSKPNRQVLIYNKDESFLLQEDASESMLKMMDGSLKKFFNAELVDTILYFHDEVKFQNW